MKAPARSRGTCSIAAWMCLVCTWAVADDAKQVQLAAARARCTESADLIACGEALNIKPNDPELLIAEADALVRTKRPGEAIGVYRNAMRRGAKAAVVNSKVVMAQAQRRTLLDICLAQQGPTAERACDAAWLPGASDEVSLFKRRGLLLLSQGQKAAALEAYLAAARLRPADRSVARAVVELSSVGRKDASNFTALGMAFMTLGRRAEAVAAFRQALHIDPKFLAARDQLRAAEHPVLTTPSVMPHDAIRAAASSVSDAPIDRYSNEADATRTN